MDTALTGSNRVAAVAAFVVGLMLVCVSFIISYGYGQLAGATEAARDTLSAQGVLIIAIKAIAPFIIYAAWRRRHWVIFGLALTALLLSCTFSLIATYGYGAAHRGVETVHAEGRADVRAQLDALPAHLPTAVLQAKLDAARLRAERNELRTQLAIAKEADRLRAELAGAVAPTLETQVQALSATAGVSGTLVRAFVIGVPAAALELGELICFFGASILWRTRQRGEPEQPPLAKEPVPEPEAEPEVPATESRPRMTLGKWLAAYLETARGTVTASTAYEAYAADWKKRRRKAVERLEFGRQFDVAAKRAGLARSQVAGRLEYKAA